MAKKNPNKPVSASAVSQGKLRIIGGTWRSRQLPILQAEGLRPTTDRVRETLFNWLQTRIAGSRCLDLFAGSGALGFEAASRGASEVQMIEQNAQVFQQLQENCQLLKAVQVKCRQANALDYLQQADTRQFDIVFLDPPYQLDLMSAVCQQLTLVQGALVYVETQKNQTPELPSEWNLLKDKTAGQIHYRLYEVDLLNRDST